MSDEDKDEDRLVVESFDLSEETDASVYFAVIDGQAVRVYPIFVTEGGEAVFNAATAFARVAHEKFPPRADDFCPWCSRFIHSDDCVWNNYDKTLEKTASPEKEG